MPSYRIELYRPEHRQAVREICAATAWMGRPDPLHVPDGWIWAEIWTRYYTDVEPQHTWVATESDRVIGYLTGTSDSRPADRYLWRMLPGIIGHVIRRRLLRDRSARSALLGLGRSVLRGELNVPKDVLSNYPATLHLDLLPEARGAGLGRRLFGLYLDRMRELKVRGVHAQTLSINEPISRFNRAAGFRPIASHPLTAYAAFDPQPVEIQTWVLDLHP